MTTRTKIAPKTRALVAVARDIDECIEIGPASEMPAGVAWRGGLA